MSNVLPSSGFDARGCLSEAGLREVLSAPLGQAPQDLAQHLARCDRCQQRLLLASSPPRPPRRKTPATAPSPRRMLLLLALLLLSLAAFLVTLRMLTG